LVLARLCVKLACKASSAWFCCGVVPGGTTMPCAGAVAVPGREPAAC
jgi:hypothetical protein